MRKTKEERERAKLLTEFIELDFRIRCCRNFTPAEAQRMVYLVNRINKLNPPVNTFAFIMLKNDKRADEARELLDSRDIEMAKVRAKEASEVRPVQTKKQRVQAHLAQCKSGYV